MSLFTFREKLSKLLDSLYPESLFKSSALPLVYSLSEYLYAYIYILQTLTVFSEPSESKIPGYLNA